MKKRIPANSNKKKIPNIEIDIQKGLVFENEKEVLAYFQPNISVLEKAHGSFLKATGAQDISELNWPSHLHTTAEESLELTLDEPQEIWHDDKTFEDQPIYFFVRPFEEVEAYHVAVCYVSDDDEPTFIFLHFVTYSLELLGHYRRGELVYDRSLEEVHFAAIEGDSLADGDPLAIGLFISMLKVRGDKDIDKEKFKDLGTVCREETIEAADEIWRYADLEGNTIVTFIKEFPDHEIPELHYLAVTVEDQNTKVHSLLFSFPTFDMSLVDRYRQGENLHADEVTQESSH